MIRTASLGLFLTVVVTIVLTTIWGSGALTGAATFGLLATVIQVLATGAMRGADKQPFEKAITRWVAGIALRLTGIAVFAILAYVASDIFWPLPSAFAFLGVLVPLLFMEIKLVDVTGTRS